MKVTKVIPSGYCKGVLKAINLAVRTRNENPDDPIYVLGMLVHNRYVVEALKQLNIQTLESRQLSKSQLLDQINDGIVIFTAHGIDPKIRQKAINKGLRVVDASCDDVLKNRQLCLDYLGQGYDIIYIGKKNHPEAEAVVCLDERIHLVSDAREAIALKLTNPKILITNQTTMSVLDIAATIDEITAFYPQAVIAQEICSATRKRQSAVMNLSGFDCLIVVGDPTSNNTAQLASVAARHVDHVITVEKAADLLEHDFSCYSNVAVTAGASTPSYLTDQIIGYLNTGDRKYLNIDISSILSR